MKKLLPFFLLSLLIEVPVNAQIVEVYGGTNSYLAGEKKPEFFGKTLLDYGFSAQLQATTQAIKIYIGEPQGFSLPLYLLVGATNGDFGKNDLNKGTISSLINSTGGLLNVSGNFYWNMYKSSSNITSLKFSTLLGGKLVSGRDVESDAGLFKPAAFGESGLYFQTGAWEKEDGYKDGGIFWLQARYALVGISKDNLQSYFGTEVGEMPTGLKIETGIYIADRVNIKLSYYQPVTGKDIPTLGDNQFKIAFDYDVSK